MGKALIVSEQGAGEYTATIVYDTERAQATITNLGESITDVESKILAQQVVVIDAQSTVDSINAELNSAINAGEDLETIQQVISKLSEPAKTLSTERLKLSNLKLERMAAIKQKAYIENNLPDPQPQTMWCADYNEGLTGEVGTVEINGELGSPPVIYPAGVNGDQANYQQARDFQMQPVVSSGPSAAFFNKALLPSWQKWMPMYRVGKITSLSGDNCSITLDDALSSQQSLDINQSATLQSVPIVYMTENGSAFEVDDRVVVEFQGQDWTQPRVIGFESNPRSGWSFWVLNDVFSTAVTHAGVQKFDKEDNLLKLEFDKEADSYSRNLERVGGDFYWSMDNTTICRNMAEIVTDAEPHFAVNSQYLFTHERDTQTYNQTIRRHDRQSGAIIDSFQASATGSKEEDRPWAMAANDTHLFYFIDTDNGAGNGALIKCDFDGSNPVQLWSSLYMPPSIGGTLRYESWRRFRVTNDRIYVAAGNTTNSAPVNCYVYDAADGSYLMNFGPLPWTTGTRPSNYTQALAADDKRVIWLEHDSQDDTYIHVWERQLTYDQNGDILTETFVKRANTGLDISGISAPIKGGLSL